MTESSDIFSGLGELPPSVPRVLYENPPQLAAPQDSVEKQVLRENHALREKVTELQNKVTVLQNTLAVRMNEIKLRKQRERDLENTLAMESNLKIFNVCEKREVVKDKNLNPWYEGEAEPPRYSEVAQLPERSEEDARCVPCESGPAQKKQRTAETWTCEICERTVSLCNRKRHLKSEMHLIREYGVNAKASSS